ncbi:MAG: hypothetical protein V1702_04690 [Candidatus Woesearchaeota archaeon]
MEQKQNIGNENAANQIIICAALITAIVLAGIFVDSYYATGATSWNVTTRLNVTNTEPNMNNVILDDLTSDPSDIINLNAGAFTEVLCNGSAYDPNGQNDMINATATIYEDTIGRFGATSKFNRYDNTTCLEYYNVPGTTMNRSFICRFLVDYWAFNSTWECNITIRDHGGTQLPSSGITSVNTSGTDEAVIYQLTAINVSTQILDFGNLSVTDTSVMKGLNITNVGNVRTNFTVYGYGGNDSEVLGANLSCMLCTFNNITASQMRFSNSSSAAWDVMVPLNSTLQMLNNVTLLNRTDENTPLTLGTTSNTTYWRIKVPLSVGGLCNGTLEFSATTQAS